eukprot:1796975-Ditylum_brightwellii.AAC.1
MNDRCTPIAAFKLYRFSSLDIFNSKPSRSIVNNPSINLPNVQVSARGKMVAERLRLQREEEERIKAEEEAEAK